MAARRACPDVRIRDYAYIPAEHGRVIVRQNGSLMDTRASNLKAASPAAAQGPLARAASRTSTAIRRACRRYCERVVSKVLPEAPLGGHDWFMDLTEAR